MSARRLNKPLKTYLIVTPFFPSPVSWRGAYCYDFVVALRKVLGANWRVEVFVPGNGEDFEIGNVLVHRFPQKILPSNIFPFLYRCRNEEAFLAAIDHAGIPLNNIAICHAHTANFAIYPLSVQQLNPACKTLLHHHDLMSFGLNLGRFNHWGLYNNFLARQLKELHEQIDIHVFISRLCEKSFRSFPNVDWLGDDDYSAQARGVKRLLPVNVKQSIVLHNGVNTEIFSPSETGRQNSDNIVIGCVGNISIEKGQYDLLEAIEIVNRRLLSEHAKKHVKVRFVGSGRALKQCKKFVNEHRIDVEFLQEMRHEKLADFYRGLDLFILPTWLDGFGCVYTEAYACGVPFIATTRAGVEELIPESDRELWLVEPHDVERLAKCILSFVKNRPHQKLKSAIDIQTLVQEFAKSLGCF